MAAGLLEGKEVSICAPVEELGHVLFANGAYLGIIDECQDSTDCYPTAYHLQI